MLMDYDQNPLLKRVVVGLVCIDTELEVAPLQQAFLAQSATQPQSVDLHAILPRRYTYTSVHIDRQTDRSTDLYTGRLVALNQRIVASVWLVRFPL